MIKKFEGLILGLALILPISAIGQVYMEVPSWQYVPVDSIFWEKVKSLQQKKDLLGVISLAEEKLQNAKSELEQAETHYVTAMACLGSSIHLLHLQFFYGVTQKKSWLYACHWRPFLA